MKQSDSLGSHSRFCGRSTSPIGRYFRALMLLWILPLLSSPAATLQQARVSQVVRDVKLLPGQAAPRPAQLSDEVRNGTAVRTGVDSRAELTFTDQTLARLGANSIFSFNEGTRNLDLGGGAMLLRVPKNAGGAQITTAAITAAITGTTIMLEYHPKSYCKFIVLEGTGRIFRKDRVGESVLVHAGQMLIVNPNGKGLPEPVDVDLDRLTKTSGLINGFPPLLSNDLIAREIGTQTTEKAQGGLVQTNLVIFGGGTAVSLLDPTQVALVDQANANEARQTPTPTTTPSATVTPTPTVTMTPTPTVSPTPSKFGTPSVISSPVPYVIGSNTTISTDLTITTNGITDFGKIYRSNELDGPASLWFFGETSDFDNEIGFDQNIFIGDRVPVAAFKFTALNLSGAPTVLLGDGGPNNLALISVGDLTSGAPGGTLDLSNLNLLFLATVDGSITLSSDLTFQNIPTLAVYARGADSTLTFDSSVVGSAIVGLLSEEDIAATNSLTISETNGPSAPNGFIISLLAGQSINVGQDLTFSITNTDTMSSALIALNSLGDTTVNGPLGLNLTIANNGPSSHIEGDAALLVSSGGDLTADAVNLFLNDRDGGTIDAGGSIFFSVGGAMNISNDAEIILSTRNDGQGGGVIGSNASITFSAASVFTGGFMDIALSANAGGSLPNAILAATVAGNLTSNGGYSSEIQSTGFNLVGGPFVEGGLINGDALLLLNFGSVTSGDFFDIEIDNFGEGTIAGQAILSAGIAADLTTQGDIFCAIDNSPVIDSNGLLVAGGTIGGDAIVNLAAGDIVSGGFGDFAIFNNSSSALSEAGVINGDASVSVLAASISTANFFQPLIFNTNGTIGGSATNLVSVTGDINISAGTFFNVINTNGQIGNDALSILSAANYSSGSPFELLILNDGGSIGGTASLTAALSGSLTSIGDAFIQIINSGGTIGGNASIDLSMTSLTANSFLFDQIDNNDGTIGGSATINSTVTGSVTVSQDADFNIFGSSGATGAAINFNGGTYNVGGTFLSTIDADGAITFNNANINADVLKAGVFGATGSLTINGGRLSGNTELKLYAPGSNGRLDFVSNVTLDSNSSVILAANAVTINNGIVVTITGDDGVAASVFTNVPNYTGSGGNGSTTGTFAGNGATTQPLDQAPPFDSGGEKPAKAKTPPSGPQIVKRTPVVRVADSNQLLNLLDRIGSPTSAAHDRSDAATRTVSHSAGRLLPGRDRDASVATLTSSRVFDRRPAALP